MDPERWRQIDKLLEEALDQEPGHRKTFLEQACAGDVELREEVEALLVAHDKAGSFVETPALDLAAQGLARTGTDSFVGMKLGPYEILSLLGKGGMGEVYRARDTRLDRMDALKILPVEVATDADRLRRFIREAKAASALNHPNIATIYEIGESDGVHWIAMELVEGQTLADRLTGSPLATEEMLDIAVQVTEALEAARQKGVIHRDIKPANLMLTPTRQVKVLDFGLAKVTRGEVQSAAVAASTDSQTFPGMVMGTARYMSPEQVLGQPVDHRTDIFSLGVVLYEMVTGKPQFPGETPSAIFDAILHQTPTWPPTAQAGIPEELRRIIQKALEKFREMRYQSAAHLDADLKRLQHELERKTQPAPPADVAHPSQPEQAIVPGKRKWILVLAGLLGLFVFSTVILLIWKSRFPPPLETPLTPVPLTSYPGWEEGASFSPDGTQVAFAWNGEKEDNWDIYVKLIGSEHRLRLTTNLAADTWPAWSPDGRQIAFCRDLGAGKNAVILISPLGGPEQILTECILAGANETGPFLSWSPDGRALAMVEKGNPGSNPHLVLFMMETGEKQVLTKTSPNSFPADSCPAFSPDGRILAFCRWIAWASSDLYLLDLSPDLKPVGEPRRLTFQNLSASGVAWVSDGSALVYSAERNLWRVAVHGSSQPQKLASLGQDAHSPAISPRASRLAYTRSSFDHNIWRIEISSPGRKVKPPSRFISSTFFDAHARYSPDGKKIAFVSDRSGSFEIWVCDADGLNAIQLTQFGRGWAGDEQWSPDNSRLTFDSNVDGHPEVYVVNASGGKPRRLTFSSGSENPSWSNDGHWVYFNSMESAIQKVPPEGGPGVLVKKNAPGYAPIESADGKSIFVTGSGTDASNLGLWRVAVERGESDQVLDSLAYIIAYVVRDDGIYFIPRPDPATGYSIRFLDFATGKIKTIAELGKQDCWSLSVSPDRRWALYSQRDQSDSDLMLVENFR